MKKVVYFFVPLPQLLGIMRAQFQFFTQRRSSCLHCNLQHTLFDLQYFSCCNHKLLGDEVIGLVSEIKRTVNFIYSQYTSLNLHTIKQPKLVHVLFLMSYSENCIEDLLLQLHTSIISQVICHIIMQGNLYVTQVVKTVSTHFFFLNQQQDSETTGRIFK